MTTIYQCVKCNDLVYLTLSNPPAEMCHSDCGGMCRIVGYTKNFEPDTLEDDEGYPSQQDPPATD